MMPAIVECEAHCAHHVQYKGDAIMNKRSVILSALLILFAVLMAGCGGNAAPTEIAVDFTLPDSKGNMVILEDVLAENEQVVLVFYYEWTCSECIRQLKQIDRDYASYEERGAKVMAVAVQDVTRAAATAFAAKAQFPILADPDHVVAEAYGVYDTLPEDFGRATPSVFIINQDREITWKQINESVYEDGEEVESTCGTERVSSEVILENLA